jgi:hypothetical protein
MSVFKNMPLTKRSFTSGTRVKGTWVEGQPVDTNFKGTAQPASGRVIELLPEGKRNTETISVYAPIALDFITADPELKRSGDIIIWQGRQYEVLTARKWDAGILPHWELAATRVKEGET